MNNIIHQFYRLNTEDDSISTVMIDILSVIWKTEIRSGPSCLEQEVKNAYFAGGVSVDSETGVKIFQ